MPLLESFRRAAGAALESLAVRIQHGDLRPALARAIQRGKAAEADVQKLSEIIARVAVGLSQSGFPLDPGEDLGRAATRVALNRANLAKQLREHVKHAQSKTCWPDDCPLCFEHAAATYEDRPAPAEEPANPKEVRP